MFFMMRNIGLKIEHEISKIPCSLSKAIIVPNSYTRLYVFSIVNTALASGFRCGSKFEDR